MYCAMTRNDIMLCALDKLWIFEVPGVHKLVHLPGESPAGEMHWYKAHGIGKKEMKIKRII